MAELIAKGLPDVLKSALFKQWDEEVASALTAWKCELPSGAAALVEQVLDDGRQQAQASAWQMAGSVPRSAAESPSRKRDRIDGALLTPLGSEDPECPHSEFAGLQTRLCNLFSASRIDRVRSEYVQAEDWTSVRLIDDLRHEKNDHTWLWMIAGADAPPMTHTEFRTAVRVRIGADIVDDEITCSCCGGTFDRRGLHALRCAPGESMRGHGAISSVVHRLAYLGDSSASAEPRGLVPSRPALRPADILTSAFCRQAALDVCVASPDAGGAGGDACAAAIRRKRRRYGDAIDELHSEGYDYRPLVWSCWGRPDADASVAIQTLSSVAARRRGWPCGRPLEQRACALIGAHVWRRVARMVLSCAPGGSADDMAELMPGDDGHWDSQSDGDSAVGSDA